MSQFCQHIPPPAYFARPGRRARGIPMRILARRIGPAVAVLGLVIGATGRAEAASVVVPNSLANTEGNSTNGFPFDLVAAFGLTNQRYQQDYAASQFSGGSGLITQIAFRPDVFFGSAFTSTLP